MFAYLHVFSLTDKIYYHVAMPVATHYKHCNFSRSVACVNWAGASRQEGGRARLQSWGSTIGPLAQLVSIINRTGRREELNLPRLILQIMETRLRGTYAGKQHMQDSKVEGVRQFSSRLLHRGWGVGVGTGVEKPEPLIPFDR